MKWMVIFISYLRTENIAREHPVTGMVKYSYEREGMSAERNASCALALLMSMDVKFVNTFQRNAQYFNTYCKISLYVGNRFAVDN